MNPQPAVATTTINDLIPKVKAALQNNSNVTETQANPQMRPSAWIQDSLREITANYPFTELQKPGPLVTIGPCLGWNNSNYMYPVSMFLAPGDDVTIQEDPVIFLNGTQAAQVGLVANTSNVVGYPMDYLSPKAIQPLLFIPGGVPFKYTRYGNMFWFGSQPGQNYNVYLPYQVRHPFNPNLVSTVIKLPDDWLDVLAYAAAERGAICNRWNDQATYLHNILYGDPKSAIPGTGELARPGLIAARIFQPERDKRLSPVQVIPGAQRY
jgi:hypothetical protein